MVFSMKPTQPTPASSNLRRRDRLAMMATEPVRKFLEENYTVDHSGNLVIIGPDGTQWHYTLNCPA